MAICQAQSSTTPSLFIHDERFQVGLIVREERTMQFYTDIYLRLCTSPLSAKGRPLDRILSKM